MTGTVEEAARKSSWQKWLLIASLALNLLIVGGAAGAFWSHRHGGHHPGQWQGREHGLMGFVRELAPERQGEMRAAIQSEREKIKPLRESVKEGWKETNAVLGTEPFDKEKLSAAMTRMIDAETRMKTAITSALVETAAKLNPDERQKLKAWREKQGMRFGGKRGWRERWREGRDAGTGSE
jgi:uncharacterized membrane protein